VVTKLLEQHGAPLFGSFGHYFRLVGQHFLVKRRNIGEISFDCALNRACKPMSPSDSTVCMTRL